MVEGEERTGEQAYSTVYWCCKDAPKYKDLSDYHKKEVILVRSYLEYCSVCTCRKQQFLEYFVEGLDDAYKADVTLCYDMHVTNNIN